MIVSVKLSIFSQIVDVNSFLFLFLFAVLLLWFVVQYIFVMEQEKSVCGLREVVFYNET
jgi:hypothetical protein